MEQEFRETWARARHLVRRLHPHHASRGTRPASPSSRRRIYDAGDIYEGVYEGWYCVGCEAFKQEKDLVDGNCPLHPTLKPRVDPGEELLLPAVEVSAAAARSLRGASRTSSQPDIRRNEILRLLEGGLEDISVSRAGQSWGIPLPFDPAQRRLRLVRRADQLRVGRRPRRRRRAMFAKWWPADLHVIGKDITRFHA